MFLSVFAILFSTVLWSVYFLFWPSFGKLAFGGLLGLLLVSRRFSLCTLGELLVGLGCDCGGLFSESFHRRPHLDGTLAFSVERCNCLYLVPLHHYWEERIVCLSHHGTWFLRQLQWLQQDRRFRLFASVFSSLKTDCVASCYRER